MRIVAQKRVRWTRAQAEKFYEEHKARPFYGELVDFMTSGPIVLQVLEGDNAIAKYREVMGATDPKEAAEGTVRKLFAESKGANSTHGSDSAAAADREIGSELPPRRDRWLNDFQLRTGVGRRRTVRCPPLRHSGARA